MSRPRSTSDAAFVPIEQPGTFLDLLGGLMWRHCDDRAETMLVLAAHHLNPNGSVHGGVLTTMLDVTLGMTAERQLRWTGTGAHASTVQLSCAFVAPAGRGDTLVGQAAVDRSARTMSFVSGQILRGDAVVATGSAIFRNPRPAARE